jgi:hypothetical protein
MKNAVLILLLLLLPWQSVIAAERNLTHALGSGHGMAVVLHHMAERAGNVLHHHDNDGGGEGASDDAIHVDQSQKSVQYLADFEHGNSVCLLHLAAFNVSTILLLDRRVVLWPSETFSNRTTSPLLRPPRVRLNAGFLPPACS